MQTLAIVLLVSIGAYPSGFIVECAVDVGTVIECPLSSLDRPPPALVHEVPVEASEGSVLVAFVL